MLFSVNAILNLSCEKQEAVKNKYIFGHAGMSLSPERFVFPPNSEESIRYALAVLQADGVEIDLQLSKDSVLVLFHDAYTDEFLEHNGCIGEFTYQELKSFEYYDRFKIIDLKTAINCSVKTGKYLVLDLKNYDYCAQKRVNNETYSNALKKELDNLTVEEKRMIYLTSQRTDLLTAISDTMVQKYLEITNLEVDIDKIKEADIDGALLRLEQLNQATESALIAKQIPYGVFNVKIKKEIKKAVGSGVNFIISDNIATTKKKLN
jgi:glycerophosphoryl diester phosphodiesterase